MRSTQEEEEEEEEKVNSKGELLEDFADGNDMLLISTPLFTFSKIITSRMHA